MSNFLIDNKHILKIDKKSDYLILNTGGHYIDKDIKIPRISELQPNTVILTNKPNGTDGTNISSSKNDNTYTLTISNINSEIRDQSNEAYLFIENGNKNYEIKTLTLDLPRVEVDTDETDSSVIIKATAAGYIGEEETLYTAALAKFEYGDTSENFITCSTPGFVAEGTLNTTNDLPMAEFTYDDISDSVDNILECTVSGFIAAETPIKLPKARLTYDVNSDSFITCSTPGFISENTLTFSNDLPMAKFTYDNISNNYVDNILECTVSGFIAAETPIKLPKAEFTFSTDSTNHIDFIKCTKSGFIAEGSLTIEGEETLDNASINLTNYFQSLGYFEFSNENFIKKSSLIINPGYFDAGTIGTIIANVKIKEKDLGDIISKEEIFESNFVGVSETTEFISVTTEDNGNITIGDLASNGVPIVLNYSYSDNITVTGELNIKSSTTEAWITAESEGTIKYSLSDKEDRTRELETTSYITSINIPAEKSLTLTNEGEITSLTSSGDITKLTVDGGKIINLTNKDNGTIEAEINEGIIESFTNSGSIMNLNNSGTINSITNNKDKIIGNEERDEGFQNNGIIYNFSNSGIMSNFLNAGGSLNIDSNFSSKDSDGIINITENNSSITITDNKGIVDLKNSATTTIDNYDILNINMNEGDITIANNTSDVDIRNQANVSVIGTDISTSKLEASNENIYIKAIENSENENISNIGGVDAGATLNITTDNSKILGKIIFNEEWEIEKTSEGLVFKYFTA